MSSSANVSPVAGERSVKPNEFVEAMSHVCTSVTVVTTDGAGGRYGATVSAMCSVSADPPHVLICISGGNLVTHAIEVNQCFCVNVLGLQHLDVAQVFAGRRPRVSDDRFACAAWDELPTGSPVLSDAVAVFDCSVVQQVSCATHQVFIGRVLAAYARNQPPLAYAQRTFCEPHPVGRLE